MHGVIEGIVVEGDHRGRQLGFPTANVALGSALELPDDGVYAGYVTRANGARYAAAISIGHRPTFYDDAAPPLVEAHLLDFDGDLYGERIVVKITEQLREQERFSSAEELIAQIDRDVGAVRRAIVLPRAT